MTMNATARIFTASFVTSATTAAVDLISLLSTAASKYAVRALDIFSISTDTAASAGVRIELWRTTGASASTGSAIVPTNVKGHTGAPAAVTGANGPSSVPLTTGANAAKLYQGALGPGGFIYCPEEAERPQFTTNAPRFHARASATAAVPALAGTVTFEELGRNPST